MKPLPSLLLALLLMIAAPLTSAAEMPGREMRPLAEKGQPGAQFLLGFWLIMEAPKEERDVIEGAKWLRKAAEQDFSRAQYMMAVLYQGGVGVPKDAAESIKWLRRAAENDDPLAQMDLAIKYENGDGVPQDNEESLKWLRKAAEADNEMAMYNLGFRYTAGEGVPRDIKEGLKWILAAAEAGDKKAQFNIATRYTLGVDVPEDPRLGYRWMLMCYKPSDPDKEMILRHLQDLRQKLTREQQVEEEKWVLEKREQLAEAKKKKRAW